MNDEVKVFDALKARKILDRVNNFLGILIRENLVKDASFLRKGELENESDLADDVWDVLQDAPRNCDVGTEGDQAKRFVSFCKKYRSGLECSNKCPCIRCRGACHCMTKWAQMPYEDGEVK